MHVLELQTESAIRVTQVLACLFALQSACCKVIDSCSNMARAICEARFEKGSTLGLHACDNSICTHKKDHYVQILGYEVISP